MKILKRTLQWLTGIVLGLYLSAMVMLNIPAVQRYAAGGIASLLSSILETRVDIGRVNISWNARIIIDDLRIEDHQGMDALTATRVGARIEVAELLRKRIRIGNAQLFSMRTLVYPLAPDSTLNVQFLIDALSSRDTTRHTPLDLRIAQIVVRRGEINSLSPRLHVQDLNVTAQLNALTDDSLNVRVRRFDMKEECGLEIKEMAFMLIAGKSGARLNDFRLSLPNSTLNIPSLSLTSQTHDFSYKKLPQLADLSYMAMLNAQLNPTDFAFLAPRLAEIGTTVNLSFSADGEGENAFIRNFHVFDGQTDCLSVMLSGKIRDFTHGLESIYAEANLEQLHIDQSILSPYISHPLLSRLRTLDSTGKFYWNKRQGRGNMDVRTPLGSLRIKGEGDTGRHLEANVVTEEFRLGDLLERKELGIVAMDVNAQGELRKAAQWTINGNVSELDFRGYRYYNIALDGKLHDKQYEGRIDVGDMNLTLHAEGRADLASQSIKATADISNFAPHTLNLTRRYPATRFAGEVDVDITGYALNKMDGTLQLNDFTMTDSIGTYRPGDIHITSRPDDDELNLRLISPFLEAQLKGDLQPRHIVAQVKQMLSNYLPMINGTEESPRQHADYGTLEVRLHNAEPLRRLLGIPLTLTGSAMAYGEIDAETGALLLKCSAPGLTYGSEHLQDISIRMQENAGQLQCAAALQRLMKGRWVELGMDTWGKEGRLTSRFFWNNHDMPSYAGDLSVISRLWKDPEGKSGYEGEILPSSLLVGDTLWNINPGFISYYNNVLKVDSFRINRGNRFIDIAGRASRQESDTLRVQLQKMNLEYIFSLINFHAVELTGEATGHAYAHSLFSKPKADAFIRIPLFALNYGTMGDLNIRINWGERPYSILLDGDIQSSYQSPQSNLPYNSRTLVKGYITPKKDIPYHGIDLNVRAQRVNLEFINKWTSGIFDNLQGRATGWVHIFGPFKAINIEGDALVNEASVGIPFTGVQYHVLNDSVHMAPNIITFKDAHLYDPIGRPGFNTHQAFVSGTLRHQNFKELTYDISIHGENILAYDFHDFADMNFYGTVYATGEVTLNGKPGTVNIGIKAAPDQGTIITYNATSPDKLTDTPFITYVNSGEKRVESGERNGLDWQNNTQGENVSSLHYPPSTLHQESPSSDLRIDFDLDIDNRSTMNLLMDARSGDKITLNGSGHMLAHYYNKGAFTLFGTYRVERGTYNLSLQEVIHKNFEFSNGGSLTFNGEPYDADLNLQAIHTVNGVSLNDINPKANFSNNSARVNCLMNIGGKARAPRITFDFDILNANEDEKQMVRSLISTEEERNMQVIYLLGIGRFYAYDYANDAQNQGTTAMYSLLSSTLSGTINQALSTMLGTTNWNFGANLRTGDDGWNDMDVEGMLQGNLLNHRLLINGNFGYRDNPVANSNFIGDFDVKYLLTRTGTVALKAYSETNDRYFTKSSLTTQGIGILLKKDFSSWRDLFNKRRKVGSNGK